jgi:hypothetical protein
MLSEIIVSTTTALGIGGAFTSPRFDADGYDEIAISLYSNVAGSLAVQQSNDGTNYDTIKTVAYTAAATSAICVPITAKYGRLVYTNGAVAQTSFRLYAAKKKGVDHTTALADLQTDIDIIQAAAAGLTTFSQETALATAVNGTTWKDLLDKSTITGHTEIVAFKVTKGGTWAGTPKLRITDGAGTTKLWPFGAEFVEGTDYTDAILQRLDYIPQVPVVSGYKLQFRSSDAGDGAGDTLTLNELDVITHS